MTLKSIQQQELYVGCSTFFLGTAGLPCYYYILPQLYTSSKGHKIGAFFARV